MNMRRWLALAVPACTILVSPAYAVQDELVRRVAVSRPGAEHRWLDPLVGNWDVELTWLAAGNATRTTGTSDNHWILGGRFLLCESTTGDGPSRIDATTIFGFDGREKRFFALGLHNLATSYLMSSGSYDLATQSFLLTGKQRDDATGAVFVYRELLKIDGPDRHALSVYVDMPGRPALKLLEAVYRRR